MTPSPERPLVKITYAGKSKRQRPFAYDSDTRSNSDSDKSVVKAAASLDAKSVSAAEKPLSSSSSANSDQSTSKSHPSPPTSPKSKQTMPHTKDSPSAAMPPPDQLMKAPHSRTKSISSLNQLSRSQKLTPRASLNNDLPSASAKIAKKSPVSNCKSPEADSESVAESSNTAPKIRRSEAERIAYFRKQTHCGELDDRSAQCTKCNKVVRLGNKQTYAILPWEKHRSRCDRNDAAVEDDDQADADDASTIAPSITQSATPAGRTTDSERKALLEGDPRAEEVREDEVLCRKCHKWVKLTKGTKYALRNWNGHQNRCADVVPSQRVAAAERKLQLVNDPLAKSFTPQTVECATCATSVQLNGESDYELTEWVKHKASDCANNGGNLQSGSGSLDHALQLPFPTTRPPPSSSSTDGTLIATGSSPKTTLAQGTKRAREDSEERMCEDAEDDASRPSNRPRTESYVPEEGALGWLMLPFTAFIRGFRDSLGSTDS